MEYLILAEEESGGIAGFMGDSEGAVRDAVSFSKGAGEGNWQAAHSIWNSEIWNQGGHGK